MYGLQIFFPIDKDILFLKNIGHDTEMRGCLKSQSWGLVRMWGDQVTMTIASHTLGQVVVDLAATSSMVQTSSGSLCCCLFPLCLQI
jgi:hypothetical protein